MLSTGTRAHISGVLSATSRTVSAKGGSVNEVACWPLTTIVLGHTAQYESRRPSFHAIGPIIFTCEDKYRLQDFDRQTTYGGDQRFLGVQSVDKNSLQPLHLLDLVYQARYFLLDGGDAHASRRGFQPDDFCFVDIWQPVISQLLEGRGRRGVGDDVLV